MLNYLNIIKIFSLKISPAIIVGMTLLLYFQQKLSKKADKTELIALKDEIKNDFKALKNEIIASLNEKLESSHEITAVTIDKLKSVFEAQNEKMKGIVDIQIKAITNHIHRLDVNSD